MPPAMTAERHRKEGETRLFECESNFSDRCQIYSYLHPESIERGLELPGGWVRDEDSGALLCWECQSLGEAAVLNAPEYRGRFEEKLDVPRHR